MDAIIEANRSKERELEKREELLMAKFAALAQAKAVVDSLSQELEAREVVLCEAEAKHGALMKREEEIDVKERDVLDRERQLNDRAAAIVAREEAIEAEAAELQREHEKRMFPLAALEQEVYRREAELRALEADHEGKLRAFQKRVHQEEERERLKEKQVRELEVRAKDALAKAQSREKDVDQQLASIADKNKALKATQIELESRDRDLKWRDEQIRVAQTEVQMTKTRLMNWEKELDVRQENMAAKAAELEAREQELSMKELAISDKMSRILQAEKDVEERRREATKEHDSAANLREAASSAATEAKRREEEAVKRREEVTALRESVEQLKAAATQKEESIAKRKAKLEEKERAMKDWIAEVEWREQQLAKREAQYGKDLSAATGTAAVGAGDRSSTQLNAGIVRSQLQQVQESYLAGSAAPAKRAAKKTAASSQPGDNSVSHDDFISRASNEVAAVELDHDVAKVSQAFAQCCVKFYSMSDEGVQHVFSRREQDDFKHTFEAEEQWKEDVRFIETVFGLTAKAKPAPLQFDTCAQWNAWYAKGRDKASQRKRHLQALRLSRLSDIVGLFQRKEETEALSQYFPLNHFKILRDQGASPTSRGALARTTSATDDGPSPSQPKATERQDRRNKHTEQAKAEIQQALDTLPAYLRENY